jgi:broad specificity phosphatase PhoE
MIDMSLRAAFQILFLFLLLPSAPWAATQLLLVRHGETDWNKEQRLQGHTDNPLNKNGQEQALRFSKRISKTYPDIQAIYASDLIRAYTTAVPTAKKLRLPIQKSAALREINWGELEGWLFMAKN